MWSPPRAEIILQQLTKLSQVHSANVLYSMENFHLLLSASLARFLIVHRIKDFFFLLFD